MHSEQPISETFILVLMKSGRKSHGKNLISWKVVDQKYYCSDYYHVSVNKMVLSVKHH